MKKFGFLFISLFLTFQFVSAQNIDWKHLPKHLQLFPRDLQSNLGEINIEGIVKDSIYKSLILKVFQDSTKLQEDTFSLVYDQKKEAQFQFKKEIQAGKYFYQTQIFITTDTSQNLVFQADSLVCGDVILIQGQSNAASAMFDGFANPDNRSPFIRTFGFRGSVGTATQTLADTNWYIANGDSWFFGSGIIGQWPIRLAKLILENHQMPIAIISGADAGRPIDFFQRNDTFPADLESNYGRLLHRSIAAGIVNSARAIIYYQGESDSGYAEKHALGLENLKTAWLEDYPNLEKIYLFQVNDGCGLPSLELRNAQRLFAQKNSMVSIMSTSNISGHDNCHYNFENGYKIIGERVFGVISTDLYGSQKTQNIHPPNPKSLYFSNESKTQITLELDQKQDDFLLDSNALNDFILTGDSTVRLLSGKFIKNHLLLKLSKEGSNLQSISYNANASSKIKNGNEIGMLAFYELPFSAAVPLELELNNFNLTVDEKQVELFWQTGSEFNCFGFEIEQYIHGRFQKIGFLEAGKTTDSTRNYAFRTENLKHGTHYFRLKIIGLNAEFKHSRTLLARIEPPELAWNINLIPNPVVDKSILNLRPIENQKLEVTLYNNLGQPMEILFNQSASAEQDYQIEIHSKQWQAGLYLILIKGEKQQFTLKMIVR